jgi:hypothetical protein
MLISEGKPSSDPLQEKLRQNKKAWNREVSSFISLIINFKQLMNGQPSQFLKEKSTIKEPIPGDPIGVLSSLVSDFAQLASQGKSIVQQQTEYSQKRRKKKKEVKPGGITSPALAEQLTAGFQDPILISQGSNFASRFFAWILNPGIGSSAPARIRKYRMSLLKSVLGIYKDLNKLQVAITRSTPESIFEAARLLSKIQQDWTFFKSGLNTFRVSDQKATADQGGKISFLDTKVEDIIKDFQENAAALNVTRRSKLVSNMVRYRKMVGDSGKPEDMSKISSVIDAIVEEYSKLLFELNSIYGTKAETLSAIAKIALKQEILPQENKPKKNLTPPAEVKVPSAEAPSPIDPILKDYTGYAGNFTDLKCQRFLQLIGEYRIKPQPSLLPKIMVEYKGLLALLNIRLGTNGKSFKEIFEQKNAKASQASQALQSLAQQRVEKWLGKLKHQISPFDNTSAQRLDIYKMIGQARDNVDKIMDSLEKSLSIETLDSLGQDVEKNLKEVQFMLSGLETTLKGKGFNRSFIDLLQKGKITQQNPNLDKKQRDHLEKMIETRRLRDLTDLYRGKK